MADFGVHSSFAKILGFGFGCMQNFTPNLNHLLSMANPESLSSIRLMVETVDTICRTGTGMTHFVITYTSAQLLFDLAWLWLSFVKKIVSGKNIDTGLYLVVFLPYQYMFNKENGIVVFCL